MDKILIIEDDKDNAELIRDYFEMNNFEPVIASDGDQGLKMALSGVFDIIILDIMLPGKDGFEICKELRKKTQIPILFVSAKDSDIDVVRGLGLGADDYIRKPFIPSELVARAAANLNRYRKSTKMLQRASIIKFSNIEVDFDSMRVIKCNKEISLANKEFELLAFFAKNPNKVFSRETIFGNVWDCGSFGDITTVTVHIKRLREKIEDNPNNPTLIETVRGAGYRLNINN